MATTIRLNFRPSQMSGRTGTLYFQVIHRRCTRQVKTEYKIFSEEWDPARFSIRICGTEERRSQLSLILSKVNWKLKQMKSIAAEKERKCTDVTMNDLLSSFSELSECPTFFSFAKSEYRRRKEMGREGTARTYKNALCSFQKFRRGRDLVLDEIDSGMMEQYEAWLKRCGLRRNSSSCYLRTLRTIYRKAVEMDLTEDRDIFRHVFTGFAKTPKRALSIECLRAIKYLDLSMDKSLSLARDVFLFSFLMQGMPFIDVAFLRKSDLRDGIVQYSRRKTRQTLEVAWENAMQDIVDRYSHLTEDSPYLFPIITRYDGTERQQYETMEHKVNRSLKKIGRMVNLPMPLTTYVARHTWASLARDAGCSLSVISKGMGHESLKTTQIYLDSIDTKMVAKANRKIIDKIN